MTAPQHITLTGFSGTGKTTVAALVALRLGWQAIDADDFIEEQTGRLVPDIIAQDGEAAFRRVEAAAFWALRDRPRVIVAAGGGAPVLAATRRAIVEAGLVIRLHASPVTTEARVAADARVLRALVPVDAEPGEVLEDAGHGGVGGAQHVGVLDAEQEAPAEPARERPVEERRARAAHVQVAGGRGREARDDFSHPP